jgi:sugar (pentulose or hexulose) kinase
MAVYLGVDLGTTHVKAMVWDAEENRLYLASAPTPWVHRGQQEMDGDALYGAALAVMHEALSALSRPAQPMAVAIASMGESGLFVDGTGRELTPMVGWLDIRGTTDSFYALVRQYGAGALFRRTGMSPEPKYGIARMKVQRPASSQPVYWLQAADYLLWRLSGGERTTHPSLAARTMAFNLGKGDWDDELLGFAELSRAALPRLVAQPEIVARVRHVGASLDGAGVTVAGHDHGVAAYGAELGPAAILDSSGTGEALIVMSRTPTFSEAALRIGTMWQPAVSTEDAGLVAGLIRIDGGGAAEAWARQTFGITIDARLVLPDEHPIFDPEGFGFGAARFYALGGATPEALYAAVLDGVARHIGERIADVETLLGAHFPHVLMTGGAAHHRAWLTRRRQILARPLKLMDPDEGVLFGAVRWAVAAAGQHALPTAAFSTR